jgi:5-methylcytosine-specific restriction protein B
MIDNKTEKNMLFEKVSLENIKTAVNHFNKNGIPEGLSSSKFYDVEVDGVLYPPKPIIAIANYYATGKPIGNYFSGGKNTPCFAAFKRLNIEIKTKSNNIDISNASELVLEFLEQAKTDNLKTKHYIKTYKNTKVKVSFGQGVSAKIPWISFLKAPFTTSDGIYPVYLYYKNINKLILAYGRSETNEPIIEWNINNSKSISKYFEENNYKKPDRYGDSHIFKIYDVNKLPEKIELNQDLDEIIEEYSQLGNNKLKQKTNIPSLRFDIEKFEESCKDAGLKYRSELITRYIASLATKPFVLLSGLSGSGKTKLAEAFAKWICENKEQYALIPVGADWTNREPLLGYVNALDNKEYILPENGALKLLIEANKKENETKPYFLILDEMNLSHVERYFADFLSVMESKNEFKLHSAKMNLNSNDIEDFENATEVPNALTWPKNLYIIGTVNIDETTYMFSPKVLDRANVIEFRVSDTDLNDYFESEIPLNMNNLLMEDDKTGLGAKYGEDFVLKSNKDLDEEEKKLRNKTLGKLNEELKEFFSALQEVGAEFGYRTASEIQTLFGQIESVNPNLKEIDLFSEVYPINDNFKIDVAIMQKLLPKLHGSRNKLVDVLKVLAQLCYDRNLSTEFSEDQKRDIFIKNDKIKESVIYPISLNKITRMYNNVIANGFTSYAEA